MLRRLGKSRCRMSLLSWMEAKLLLAMMSVSRLGNMDPNLRTSAQSLRLLSVMWSRRKVGQATLEALTLLYSLRHRNNSSSLQDIKNEGWKVTTALVVTVECISGIYVQWSKVSCTFMNLTKALAFPRKWPVPEVLKTWNKRKIRGNKTAKMIIFWWIING